MSGENPMSKITEKWFFDLNFSEAHKPKLDLREGKNIFHPKF